MSYPNREVDSSWREGPAAVLVEVENDNDIACDRARAAAS